MGPVKLYVPERYREPRLYSHIELLFPFWGITVKESTPYVRAAFLQYQYSKNDFMLVEHIDDAEYVVIPYPYFRLKETNPKMLAAIIQDAQWTGKPLLIDGAGDIEHPINVEHSVVLRVSQYSYSKRSNELTVPFPAEDLLETYAEGIPQLREKSEKPSVSFTGWASLSAQMRLKLWIKEFPLTLAALFDEKRGAEHKGVFFREKVLTVLAKNPHIESHFKVRASYSGHLETIEGSVKDNRKEFVKNILNSDYALCVKGDANASVRFYEALSLGRIPLFLDTSCVLPLEDKINYNEFCVFVDWRDTNRIDDILMDFHKKISPEQFKDMQRKARDTYRNYFRSDAFSTHLAADLRERETHFPHL